MKREKDIDLLARTIWGEARDQGQRGMIAVANVIMNRANNPRWWGRSVEDVIKKDLQFSTWNIGDPNRDKALAVDASDPQFRQALKIASMAVDGRLEDLTGYADHYHATYVSPGWADPTKISAHVGSHIFYRLEI